MQSSALMPSTKNSMQVPQEKDDLACQPWYHGQLSRQVWALQASGQTPTLMWEILGLLGAGRLEDWRHS